MPIVGCKRADDGAHTQTDTDSRISAAPVGGALMRFWLRRRLHAPIANAASVRAKIGGSDAIFGAATGRIPFQNQVHCTVTYHRRRAAKRSLRRRRQTRLSAKFAAAAQSISTTTTTTKTTRNYHYYCSISLSLDEPIARNRRVAIYHSSR